ncbi:hypothetical protein [Actinomadura sp. 6K520]|nr:hypothetical protein [Actinomadura sp. 6K520]
MVTALEDEHGFLAEGEIKPEAWGLERITVQAFEAAWSSGDTAPAAS